ncbi:hypothetical protein Ami103574_10775 [Aminipila butyrica]|uniref:Uncharacterized protein n=1 Tax=Aminipila butyrica TaxID=433296 RepID=A0A858BUZ9_9FIRM|nr:hypothetical protein [Aminipila butyrica]QIB69773.1 hypothetical protein Ami103574_10775 [Aminipila butyrica]
MEKHLAEEYGQFADFLEKEFGVNREKALTVVSKHGYKYTMKHGELLGLDKEKAGFLKLTYRTSQLGLALEIMEESKEFIAAYNELADEVNAYLSEYYEEDDDERNDR